MEILIKMQGGEKLPCEKVYVDENEMYRVYDVLDLDIDEQGAGKYIITDIIEDGILITRIN